MCETLFFFIARVYVCLPPNCSLMEHCQILPGNCWVIWAPRTVTRADIGYRAYSNMNISPCASSRNHRTKRRLGCASPPRLTSSRGSSCFSAESAQTMWYFGPLRLLARLRRTARRSGRISSALMRSARPIARCSECWSGAGWKLNEYTVSHFRKAAVWIFSFGCIFFFFSSGLHITRWVMVHLFKHQNLVAFYSKLCKCFPGQEQIRAQM